MVRSSIVTEDVWAKAIHAVKVQKMSLRQAAQMYGVHHMSLHRRVRGRYSTSVGSSFDIRSYLSEDDESEVLGVLREQFLHEKRITSDDIRFVVRAIASHGGKRAVPPEFPPSRWIVDFKRVHGFAKLNSYAYPPATASSSTASDADMDENDSEGTASASASASYHPRYAVPSYHLQQQQHEQQQRQQIQQQLDRDDDRREREAKQNQWDANSHSDGDRDGDGFGSNTSSGSFENGNTTGSSSGSFENGNTTGSSCGSFESGVSQSNEPKRAYKLSHTVPPETWEKAIAAVEQQGMSLRAAARVYGVHFAALHRRVKKRAQGDPSSVTMEGYFHPDDEAGIIRVVVARAELGVLMTFDELMDLVQRAALRNLPDISVDAARKLMARFQSRNEHSIRHIIVDWPLPRISSMSLNSSKNSSNGSVDASSHRTQVRVGPPRPSVIVDASGASLMNAHTLAAMAAAAPAAPMIPSMNGNGALLPPSQSLLLRPQLVGASQQLSPFSTPAPVKRPVNGDKSSPQHPIMFV